MGEFEKGMLIGLTISTVIWIFTIIVVENKCKAKAIELGCAKYNEKTSDFEWIKGK